GPRGFQGPRGLPGAGLQFTTGSGTSGPPITQPGSYFVEVEALIPGKPSEPTSGLCMVYAWDPPASPNGNVFDQFDGAYAQPASATSTGSEGNPWNGNFSFSGILTVPASNAPAQTGFGCADAQGAGPTV